jgi:hypothetical protein
MEMEDYILIHIGGGKFLAKMENGETKEAGDHLHGMIRYTYFEDYSFPEIGWKITRKQLYDDYLPKLQKDIINGKIKII